MDWRSWKNKFQLSRYHVIPFFMGFIKVTSMFKKIPDRVVMAMAKTNQERNNILKAKIGLMGSTSKGFKMDQKWR